MAEKLLTNIGRLAGAGGLATFVGSQCIFNVDGGEQAVMFNRFGVGGGGVSDKVYGEGSHLMFPWLQIPTLYSIRTRPKDLHTTTGTRDMQQITLWVRLLFKPRQDKLPFIHSTLGKEYDTAIEQKQIAEQDAQRQVYNVAKAEQEKKAAIKLAEGEAEAAEMMSRAFSVHGTGMLEVKRILAAREIAETLASANNVMYLPGGQGQNVLINAGQVCVVYGDRV